MRPTLRPGRLLKLAAYLEKLPPEKFSISRVISSCGSVGCAMGHTPKVFPKLIAWDTNPSRTRYFGLRRREGEFWSETFVSAAMRLFGVTFKEAIFLFSPGSSIVSGRSNHLTAAATPKEVAAHIRNFVRNKR